MAQTSKIVDVALAQAKQKPLRNESEGLLNCLRLGTYVFNSSRIFKVISLPDPKP